MKIVLSLVIALMSISAVSAATGSTSTGSTTPALTCLTGLPCGGGPTRAWNYTTSQFEMLPQCFPWTWLDLFRVGNISAIYENQKICREQRAIDFRF